jgi:flagellar biosynthesis protein FlhG
MNFKTLLVDADLGLANVDLQMGLEPKYTMQDVVFGNTRIQDAVIPTANGPDVLAASSGVSEMTDMGRARQQMLVEDLMSFARQYDFLIIDAGAGIGSNVTTFLSAAPEVAVVVANEPTSVMDAYSLIKVLNQCKHPPSLSLIVNMVHSLAEGRLLATRLNAITERFLGFTARVAGTVMYDRIVGDAIRARMPVINFAEGSAVATCLRDIAREFAFEDKGRSRLRNGQAFFDSLTAMSLQSASTEATP